jgi:acetylglutamate kinase
MSAPPSAADVVLRATARARALRGRTRVVKLGGSAMEDPAATRSTLLAVVALQTLGIRQVLVHGGGKPIDRAMAAAGLTPRKVAGRRYTDEATLAIVLRVLRELSAGLVAGIRDLGGQAVGFLGDDPSAYPLAGEKLTLPGPDGEPVDLGEVGTVEDVDLEELELADVRGEIPVLASVAHDPFRSQWLNVNADTAAAAVAGALRAEACLFLTDTPGVLRDVADPGSLMPRLTRVEAERLIRDGTIAGGMVPKVEACFEALDAGADRAVILDGRDPDALLAEFVPSNLSGTEIVP